MTNNISGFCLLSMPSDQIQPYSILTSQNGSSADSTGINIKDIFKKSTQALRKIEKNKELSSEINKAVTVELSVDSNISLLEQLLKFLKLSASFKLQKNKALKLHMIEPKIDAVNEFYLDAYINNAEVNAVSESFTDMLNNDQLYVVTQILKCRKYALEYADNNTTDAGVKADAATVGEASTGVHTSNTNNDNATYEGENFITIGVKSYQILSGEDTNGKTKYRIRKDEKIKTVKGDEGFKGQLLEADKVNVSNT
jgi:hypothetical protein